MSKRVEVIHDLLQLALAEKEGRNRRGTTRVDDCDGTSTASHLISITRDEDVRYWAARIGCSEHDVREAVKVVGESAEEVRRYLSYRKR